MLSHQTSLDDKLLKYSSILDDKYKIIEKIGEGRYSKVKLAIDLETRKTIAIKIMHKSQMNTPKKFDNFINEISILSDMNHSSLIQIKYASINGEYRKYNGNVSKVLYYIMKIADFGELYKFLELTLNFQEKYARFYFKQLIYGIEFIKALNIFPQEALHTKILSQKIFSQEKTQIQSWSTLDFPARHLTSKTKEQNINPVTLQVRQVIILPNSSMLSITYQKMQISLLQAACYSKWLQTRPLLKILKIKVHFLLDPYYQRLQNNSQSYWKIFEGLASPTVEFKDLIECMFRRDPMKRLTIEEIKHHPWFQGQKFKLGEAPTIQEIKKEMAQRLEIINNIQYEKVKKKREQKIKKYENFIKPPSIQIDPFENSINELIHKYQNQVKQINNLIQYNYKKRKIQKQRKQKSAKYNQENSRELLKRVETPKSSDSSDSI